MRIQVRNEMKRNAIGRTTFIETQNVENICVTKTDSNLMYQNLPTVALFDNNTMKFIQVILFNKTNATMQFFCKSVPNRLRMQTYFSLSNFSGGNLVKTVD